MNKYLLSTFFFVWILLPVNSFAQTFSDVGEDFPHYESIEWSVDQNIVQGFPGDLFKPNQNISRAEFLKLVLLRKYTVNEIENGYIPNDIFSDISKDDWFYPYITFAHQEGIIQGYTNGEFKPHSSVTFAESAKILVEVLKSDIDRDIYYIGSQDDHWGDLYISILGHEHDISVRYNQEYNVTRAEVTTFLWKVNFVSRVGVFKIYPEKVLFNGKEVMGENVDKETFRYLACEYYTDKNNLYYRSQLRIVGEEVSNFEKIENNLCYLKAENTLFLDGKELPNIDSESFQLIESTHSNRFSKDKNSVYYNGRLLPEIHPENIKIMQRNPLSYNYYLFDGSETYFLSTGWDHQYNIQIEDFRLIADFDIESKKLWMNGDYISDETNLYFRGKIVEDVNIESLEEVNSYYILDNENLIFNGEKDQNFSAETFEEFYCKKFVGCIIKDNDTVGVLINNDSEYKKIDLDASKIEHIKFKSFGQYIGSSDYFSDGKNCIEMYYNEEREGNIGVQKVNCTDI